MTERERMRQLVRRLKRLEAMDVHLSGLQARIHRLMQTADEEYVRVRRSYMEHHQEEE